MRLEPFDFSGQGETLMAVVLGALLATLSGIAATQIEAHFKRRERQRDAALLFGELLSTVQILLLNADAARGRGDPYGPVTMRSLHAARRELDIYDRNRERLYDIRDAALRVKIHAVAVRIAMPLDGIIDASADLAARPDDAGLEPLRRVRGQGFDYLIGLGAEVAPVVADLGRLARHSFTAYGPGAAVTARTATSPP